MNWVEERSSGYQGTRCRECGSWWYLEQPPQCRCPQHLEKLKEERDKRDKERGARYLIMKPLLDKLDYRTTSTIAAMPDEDGSRERPWDLSFGSGDCPNGFWDRPCGLAARLHEIN